MKCSYLNCQNASEFQCNCKNFTKNLCSEHLSEHIKDTSSEHKPFAINANPQESSSSIIVKALINTKQACQESIIKLVSAFSTINKHLDDILKMRIKELKSFSNDIENFIITVLNNPDNLIDGNLKKSLLLNASEAKAECDKWKIVKVDFSIENICESVKKLCPIDFDMSYIYGFDESEEEEEEVKNDNKIQNFGSVFEASKSAIIMPLKPLTQVEVQNLIRQSMPAKCAKKSTTRMICSKGHEYVWSPYAPFIFFSANKTFNLVCSLCEKSFSKSCWRCLVCNVYACEQCSNGIGIACPKLVCQNKHELIYRSDVNVYYSKKGLGVGYSCKNCNNTKTDSHWHCRDCNYDICTDCGKTEGFSPYIKSNLCNNNHPLFTTIINNCAIQNQPICEICKIPITNIFYNCSLCCYYQCENCYLTLKNPTAFHPSIMCPNSHFLNWAEKMLYSCPCCEITQEKGYTCKQCNFVMCGDCAIILIEYHMKNDIKVHGQQKHILMWIQKPWEIYDRDTFFCFNCQKIFKKVGIFYCNQCEIFVCLKCYHDPNRIGNQQGVGSSNMLELSSLSSLNEMLRSISFNK